MRGEQEEGRGLLGSPDRRPRSARGPRSAPLPPNPPPPSPAPSPAPHPASSPPLTGPFSARPGLKGRALLGPPDREKPGPPLSMSDLPSKGLHGCGSPAPRVRSGEGSGWGSQSREWKEEELVRSSPSLCPSFNSTSELWLLRTAVGAVDRRVGKKSSSPGRQR